MTSHIRNTGIKKIIKFFEDKGYDFSDKSYIDLFAREGDWQTNTLAKKVNFTHAIEVNLDFKNSLIKNLPINSKITICDSIKHVEDVTDKYDIIVLDNPMGCFGNNNQYCEHFEIFEKVFQIMNSKSLIIFNVKTIPFNFKNNKVWQEKRNAFYNVDDSSILSISFFKKFYENKIKLKNKQILFDILVERPQEENLYQMAFLIKDCKNENN